MAKKRQSRDQKRKAKLKERSKKEPARSPLVYQGNKYHTDELVPVYEATEVGIYQAYMVSERKLTDPDVKLAIETLILQIREGTLPEFEHVCSSAHLQDGGSVQDLLFWGIRHQWHHLFDHEPHPGNEKLVGVLRSILGSIEYRGSPAATSRGYLEYVGDFLKKAGVNFGPDAEEEDAFFADGQAWAQDGDAEAREAFVASAAELIKSGDGGYVRDVCEDLIGEYPASPAVPELRVISARAQPTTW